MVQIFVLPRHIAEEFAAPDPWACISIRAPEEPEAIIRGATLLDKLQLVFHDIDTPSEGCLLFTEDQANQIVDFVLKYWEQIEVLLIHCNAGLSRSPAVAAAISKKYFESDFIYFHRYHPNRHVCSTLYKAFTERS